MESAFSDGMRWIPRTIQGHDDGTAEVETDLNWLGNGAAPGTKDASVHIRCPNCRRFPFKTEETASCYVVHTFMFANSETQEEQNWYHEVEKRRWPMQSRKNW